jgi:hypothetical protein
VTTVDINGKESYEYFNATLVDKSIGTNKINTEIQWNHLAPEPIITDTTMGDKKITMKFLVEGSNELVARRNIGNLISELNNGIIIFSDSPLKYKIRLSGDPSITWFGDTDTGVDSYRYVVEIELAAGLAYGDREQITQTITINSGGDLTASIPFNIKGNYITPLVVSAQILGGATTSHLIYFGLNTDPTFEILNAYVKDKFAFLDMYNLDAFTVDSEQFKIKLNNSIYLPAFRGDFPFIKPGDNDLNIKLAALMSDESSIDVKITINYLPRYI